MFIQIGFIYGSIVSLVRRSKQNEPSLTAPILVSTVPKHVAKFTPNTA